MLSLLVGTPGSGKTLFAIDKIIKIANNEAPEFKNINYVYTNISGFDFDKFKDNKVIFDRFVFDSFYAHMQDLFALFLQNEDDEKLDDILQAYCKEHNLLNAYFIIDEAHNYFDNQDKVKMWWLTYHRHLNHEILFITQNKSLINTQYRNVPEIFIKAQPRSKAISKNVLRYFNYTEYRMTQKFSTTEITINDSYFSIYKSGNVSTQKRVGLKYIYMFVLFVILCFSFFGYFVYKLYFTNSSPVPDTKNNPVPVNKTLSENTNVNINNTPVPVLVPVIENKTDLSNLKYMQLLCSMKNNYCLYKNQKINLEFYLKMKTLQNFQEFSLMKTIGDFYSLDVFVSEDFFSIYNKQGVSNVQNNFNSSSSQELNLLK
jgi:zona occludens toxin